ncbi:MAG: adenylosuccinate lyase [Candidatus Izemoplasma sp.]
MLDRYQRSVIKDIFNKQSKFQAFLDVELLALDAWSKLGKIPLEDVIKIREMATFSVEQIDILELKTKHDVIAFTRNISESLGEEKKWFHYGLTSTDIVDTANGLLIKQANSIIYNDLIAFINVLKEKALKYIATPSIGRTHGIHADITSFGLKYALWYDEFNRHLERFTIVRKEIEIGKISGAVGNHAFTPPFVQDFVCKELGISSAKISTQVIQRDRHANYMACLALIGSSLEKVATEIRHLQRTEVNEVQEFFAKGQKGSSAMPHKRNPIASENISGLARVLRGYMQTSFENITLWHERDISHSSVERIIIPDAISLVDYMLNRYTNVLDKLLVYPDKMMKNIYITHGVIFSQRVMTKIIDKGLSRETAYDLIQEIAMESYENEIDFRSLLNNNIVVTKHLSKEELDDAFDINYFLKNVDEIYKRVGLK